MSSRINFSVFGNDFDGMTQGNIKTGQQGTNSMFVMIHAEIPNITKNQTITYACVVVIFFPQKANLLQICITIGGNLVSYPGKVSMCIPYLTTSKFMWKSVLSTKGAEYMCLDIKKVCLTAPLDQFEYMKILHAQLPQ